MRSFGSVVASSGCRVVVAVLTVAGKLTFRTEELSLGPARQQLPVQR